MACTEIDTMRKQVLQALGSNVTTWQSNLQSRWGDPRVYEMQKEQRLKQDAALAFDLARRNETLLEDAYARRAEKQRKDHSKRLETLKRQNYRAGGTRPGSQTEPLQTKPLPPMPDPTQPQFPEPAAYQAWPN